MYASCGGSSLSKKLAGENAGYAHSSPVHAYQHMLISTLSCPNAAFLERIGSTAGEQPCKDSGGAWRGYSGDTAW